MTIGKASALSLGFVGAVALGIWIGPYVTGRADALIDPAVMTSAATETPASSSERRAAASPRMEAMLPAVSATSVELQQRLKPVLNEGTNLKMAADGFRSGEQFAAVAHAARNLGVPFMVLKQQVVDEGKSLASAIRDLKPDVDAAKEAIRARTLARADVAAIAL